MVGEPTDRRAFSSTAGRISASSIVSPRNQQSAQLENEVVLFDLESGRYYGLEAVGARIWELIQEPKTVAELQQAIAVEYDVDATRCEQDLIAFLQGLLERQLIEVTGE